MTNFTPVASEPKVASTPIVTVAPKNSQQKSLIFIMTMGAICSSLLTAVLSVAVLVSLNKTKAEVMHSYVVEANGNRLAIHQITDPNEQAQHIQNFAAWFVGGLHSYRWYIDGDKGEKIPDPGLLVTGGKKIPSAVYVATLAMRPALAIHYRKNIAEVIAEKNISAKESSYFKTAVGGVSPPQRVGKDLWKIYVKGTQISVAESGEERRNERYVVLTIGRIIPVSLSIAQRDYKDIALAKAYAETSAAGLEVQSIEDLASKYSTNEPLNKPTAPGANNVRR
jgi:hypothetical protein